MTTKKVIEDAVSKQLETRSFEEILEDFDLTPEEVFWGLFKQGLVDFDLLEKLYDIYE